MRLVGYNIRSAVVRFVSQICEIMRNSEKIRTYGSSKPSKVIDLGATANRKRMRSFLLVINSSLTLGVTYRFRDTDTSS